MTMGPVYGAVSAFSVTDGLLRVIIPVVSLSVSAVAGSGTASVAAAMIALSLPWLLISIPAGPIIDKRGPAWSLRVVTVVRIVGLALLVVGASTAEPLGFAFVLLACFLVGTAETVQETGFQSLVPRLVPRERLAHANTVLFGMITLLGMFAAPALGGLLLQAGQLIPLLIACAAAVLGLACVTFIRMPSGSPDATRDDRGYFSSLGVGFTSLRNDPGLLLLAAVGFVTTLAWFAWQTLFVVFVIDELKLGSLGYSVFLVVLAAGTVCGTLTLGFIRRRVPERALLVASLAGWVIWFGTPAATSAPWALAVALFIGGIASVWWNVLSITVRQRSVPAHELGRVTSVYRTITRGGRPLGAALGGVLGIAIGTTATFGWAAAATALMIPVAWIAVRRGKQAGWFDAQRE